jgi:CO dehydrogenase/acetyl-CoA synthase delta subunit
MTSALKKGGSPRGYLVHVRVFDLLLTVVSTPVRTTYQHLPTLDFDPAEWARVSSCGSGVIGVRHPAADGG